MKIVKYFYSKPTFVETMVGITDEEGNYLDEVVYVRTRKPRARITACGIFDTETKKMKIGVARCSHKDIFLKSVGKELAYKRAETNPIMEVEVLNGETLSSVFFDQARLLDKRYSTASYIKF